MLNKILFTSLLATLATVTAFSFARLGSVEGDPFYGTLGSLTFIAPTQSADPGQNLLLICEAKNPNGAPSEGAPCLFEIVSAPPGGGATVGANAVTDTQGTARSMLFTGSTPGTIVVRISAAGLSRQLTFEVRGVASAAPARPQITPPATGDSGLR